MSQVLSLIFDSQRVRLFRIIEKEINSLEVFNIEASASFFFDNLKDLIRRKHQHPDLIRMYYLPEKYTLIPNSIFLSSKLNDYFKLNFGSINDDEILQYELISSVGIVVIYSIPRWLVGLKSDVNSYGDVKTVLGINLSLINEHKSSSLINCSINDGKMDVIVKCNGKLTLANHYEIQNEEDVIYFILLIIQELRMSSSTLFQLILDSSSVNVDQFKLISSSIVELSSLPLELIESKTYFNSILCV